jgi:hypothetical protein
VNNKTCENNLKAMLSCCESLYVNSDAHTLYEFINVRNEGFKYLKSNTKSNSGKDTSLNIQYVNFE